MFALFIISSLIVQSMRSQVQSFSYPTEIVSAQQSDRLQIAREKLLLHPIYSSINTTEKLRTFMESHVFVVYDYMLMLKTLQKKFTNQKVFLPLRDKETGNLLNEIALREETAKFNIGNETVTMSRFELYLLAMKEVGANTSTIDHLIKRMYKMPKLSTFRKFIMSVAEVPHGVKSFCHMTLQLIRQKKYQLLGAFLERVKLEHFQLEMFQQKYFLEYVNGEKNKQQNKQQNKQRGKLLSVIAQINLFDSIIKLF